MDLTSYSMIIKIPYLTAEHALFVQSALQVDDELQPLKIHKVYSTEDCNLLV